MGNRMTALVILGDTSGSVTLQAPAAAGSSVQTLPAATGTVMVSGNMPAFSAYQSSSQTLSSSTTTKINFQTEEYDTNNNFSSSRFTPTVAGYYTVNAGIQVGASFAVGSVSIYKNGNSHKQGMTTGGVAGTTGLFTVACQVYLNGSTDYIECYGIINSGQDLVASAPVTYFQALMVRAA
jgi:hypothetical protein